MKTFFSTIKSIKIWQLLLLVVPLLLVTAWSLRQNNLQMLDLRTKVITVDAETGSFKKVKPHLEELGRFVQNNMNTDPGRIELPGVYNTAVEKERKKAQASGSVNSDVYKKAQVVCEDPNVFLSVRAQCIQDYVINNTKPGSDAAEIKFPDKNLYTFSFISPQWSPDLAGFMTVVTSLVATVLFFKALHWVGRVANKIIDRDPLE